MLTPISFALLLAVAAGAAPDLTGRWTGPMHARTPDGKTQEMTLYLSLKQDGPSILGLAGGRPSEMPPISKTVFDGSKFSFELQAGPRRIIRFQFERRGDDTMEGTFAGEGSFAGTVEIRRTAREVDPALVATPPKPYDDVSVIVGVRGPRDLVQVDQETLRTLTFNQKTQWPKPSPMPAELLEAAKDPGLGIRELHRQGITGKGVSVAIIDQPMLADHPEYAARIAAYQDFGCNSKTSMHGPAVSSFLVGRTIGTAPEAQLYYAAAPRWLRDAANEARALDWIVDRNRQLAADERIRVVSVSASPGMKGEKNPEAWAEALRRAEGAGILVLDCSDERAIIGPCWLRGADRNDPASYSPGFPGIAPMPFPRRVLAPASPRTGAEQWEPGEYGYTYWGRGGQSWAVPYAAGVLALGWQVRPELTPKQAVNLLFETAYKSAAGSRILHPREFIRAIREFQP